jgi:hypothetical protein
MPATLNDTALGTDDASGTTLSTSDTLTVAAGDVVFAHAKFEGATTTATFDTGASTPTFTEANPVYHDTGSNDLNGGSAFWIATSTGTVTPRVVLGAARTFRHIKAYSFTPSAGMTWAIGNLAVAQGASNSPSSGAASATDAGVAVGSFSLYSGTTFTAGSGWTEPAEFDLSSSHQSEYRIVSGAGSLTADGGLGASPEWIAQLAILTEISAGPTIRLVSPRLFYNTETGVVISGTNFGASQGAGSVTISPTDDINDAGAVTQTVTAWGATSITFTAVRSALGYGALYLFVEEDGALSNDPGYPVQFVGAASLAWVRA